MINVILKDTFKLVFSNLMIIISGVFSGFLLPKLLDVSGYGYYKLFNLYISYIVFCDLGIANGVYLLYGGYDINALPREKIRCYFRFMFFIQILFSLMIATMTLVFLNGENLFIFLMVSIYLIANNISNFFEKICILTGEFKYAIQRNITKSLLTIAIILILQYVVCTGIDMQYYKFYTILFVIIYSFLAMQYVYNFKYLVFGTSSSIIDEFDSLKKIIQMGIVLLFADMVANLILVLDRQFVSVLFDIETYSVYSFAYSMLRVVILAVSAISSVLYPALKRMNDIKLRDSYVSTVSIVSIISVFCLLGYYPLYIFVEWFLPQYVNSLSIFRILLPSITIHSVISLVIVNYFKALYKQNQYFRITVLILIFSALLNVVFYLILKDAIGLSIASVIVMIVWLFFSDNYIKNQYNIKNKKHIAYIILSTCIYYVLTFSALDIKIMLILNAFGFIGVTYVFYKKQIINKFNYCLKS